MSMAASTDMHPVITVTLRVRRTNRHNSLSLCLDVLLKGRHHQIGSPVRADQARAYVESLLERLTGSEKVVTDDDGDYPVQFRNCHYYVRLIGNDTPVVQVFSVAVADLEETPELLTDLNALNTDIRFARAFHVRGQVLIETDVLAEALDPAGFENACNCVASITLNVAPSLTARFGGRLTFADDPAPAGAPAPDSFPTGQYL